MEITSTQKYRPNSTANQAKENASIKEDTIAADFLTENPSQFSLIRP